MARTPVGTQPQPLTRTALYAYFAAQLAGIPIRSFNDLFDRWGLAIRQDGATRAASLRKQQSPTKVAPGRRPARRQTPRLDPVFREWLLIDEPRLGLELALLTFPGDGRRQTDLLEALRQTAGVRQIIETARKRDVVAIVLFAGPRERRDLRARLEEISHQIIWDDVISETHEPAPHTWRALALTAAAEEDLLA